jgi:hypothetical protein
MWITNCTVRHCFPVNKQRWLIFAALNDHQETAEPKERGVYAEINYTQPAGIFSAYLSVHCGGVYPEERRAVNLPEIQTTQRRLWLMLF